MILAVTEPQNINMRNKEVPREDEVRLSVKSLYVNGDCWKQLDSQREALRRVHQPIRFSFSEVINHNKVMQMLATFHFFDILGYIKIYRYIYIRYCINDKNKMIMAALDRPLRKVSSGIT